jgi:hypothetical protein
MTGIQLATIIIAAYGAVLSTILGLIQLVRGTRGIAVSCRIAVRAPPTGGTWEFVVVQAVNKRSRPVTIVEAGLRMNNQRFFTQAVSKIGRKPLPAKLDFGDAVEVSFDLPELEKVMAEKRPERFTLTRAFVRDAEGKEYDSRLPRILREKWPAK